MPVRDPRSAFGFHWDVAIEDKLARRDITAPMVERLFENEPVFYRNKGNRAGLWMMVGQDPVSGRRLRVAIRWREPKLGILRVVTAFDD